MSAGRSLYRAPLLAWAGLLALLALSVGVSRLPLGGGRLFANVGVATAQAAIVALLFMRLDRASPLVRIAAGAALLWIAFMFTLAGADYFMRPR